MVSSQLQFDGHRENQVALSPLRLEILRISKYKKKDIDWLRNGIRIERDAGKSIDELVTDACAARHGLAAYFLKSAALLLRLRPVRHRDVISRSHYAMRYLQN